MALRSDYSADRSSGQCLGSSGNFGRVPGPVAAICYHLANPPGRILREPLVLKNLAAVAR